MGERYDDYHDEIGTAIADAEVEFARAREMGYAAGMQAAFARKEAYEHARAVYCRLPEDKTAALESALEHGGYDVSECKVCGVPVVCLPDGLPMCETCAAKEST